MSIFFFFFTNSAFFVTDIARRFRRSAAITESWMCQSPKVKCSSPNIPEKCPTKCSSENEGIFQTH